MKLSNRLIAWLLGVLLVQMASLMQASAATRLELAGYVDDAGVITVLHGGDSSDPYFAMQALLLAHDGGMDVSVVAGKFADWLVSRQKPDGTFDRFCRGTGKLWTSCKTADADDSLLALWMKLLDTMPDKLVKNAAWQKSYDIAKVSLDHLYQPSRGVYMVSPVYLHGLFMDNLEVWSLKAHLKKPGASAEAAKLAQAIRTTFWDPVNKRFLVSTQLEQRSEKPVFYPDHVAQVFPLLLDFPLFPDASIAAKAYYKNWMTAHRADWLQQSVTDYPWGVLAVLAEQQNDRESAGCWLRKVSAMRHSSRWAVTDEVSYQLLVTKGVKAVGSSTACT